MKTKNKKLIAEFLEEYEGPFKVSFDKNIYQYRVASKDNHTLIFTYIRQKALGSCAILNEAWEQNKKGESK